MNILNVDDTHTREILARIRCFVLDMDGTIYLGNDLFEYTPAFLRRVEETGRTYSFFTNNSSKNADAYIEKLAHMQLHIPKQRMLISNEVMLEFLHDRHPGARVYLVGTPYLMQDFIQADIPLDDKNPDVVVLGFDTTLTYEKLVKACDFIRAGKPVYGVNPDLNCPVEGGGFIPDCGSIARLIEASTGVMPTFLGKPSRETLTHILRRTGFAAREIAVIGDRLYTDIALTQGSAATSILVLSGETKETDLPESTIQPDLVFPSIAQIMPLL